MTRITHSASVPDTLDCGPDWRDNAACLDQDPELWFPKGNEGPWKLVIEQAKAVCRRCPSIQPCLDFALTEGIGSGIFGGLTQDERVSLRRSVRRGNTTRPDLPHLTDHLRQSRQERTFQSIFDENTTRVSNGHLTWTGALKTGFKGRYYTAKQIAYIADRGHMPQGPVHASCGNDECVLPAHLTDSTERAQCGTRSGYQRHRKRGEEACGPCKRANADADNRLRRTGTTKAAA